MSENSAFSNEKTSETPENNPIQTTNNPTPLENNPATSQDNSRPPQSDSPNTVNTLSQTNIPLNNPVVTLNEAPLSPNTPINNTRERQNVTISEPNTGQTSRSVIQSQSSTDSERDINPKSCWVCFAQESDDTLAAWVQPCFCSGTTAWVHQSCLQRWVDEKQRGNISRKVFCPQCRAEYIIVFPSMGKFVTVLDAMEEVTHKVCPFIAGGVLLGSVYWVAITYGAVTVMQVVGHREGLEMMEAADPLVLLVLLPTIPVTLISAKMYNWEDSVLLFLRKYCTKIPALGYILPFGSPSDGINEAVVNGQPTPANIAAANNHLSPTRIFCSALLLPTISTLIGKIFFKSIKNNLHRTILGGLTYITLKGALKIYHKQMLHIRYSSRRILDYTESNIKMYRNQTNLPGAVPVGSPSTQDGQVV